MSWAQREREREREIFQNLLFSITHKDEKFANKNGSKLDEKLNLNSIISPFISK
jgi:hypothetical protein